MVWMFFNLIIEWTTQRNKNFSLFLAVSLNLSLSVSHSLFLSLSLMTISLKVQPSVCQTCGSAGSWACRASRWPDGHPLVVPLFLLPPSVKLCHTFVWLHPGRLSMTALLYLHHRCQFLWWDSAPPWPVLTGLFSCQVTLPRYPHTLPPTWASSRSRKWLSVPLVEETDECSEVPM